MVRWRPKACAWLVRFPLVGLLLGLDERSQERVESYPRESELLLDPLVAWQRQQPCHLFCSRSLAGLTLRGPAGVLLRSVRWLTYDNYSSGIPLKGTRSIS